MSNIIISSAPRRTASLLLKSKWEWFMKGKMAADVESIC